MKKIIIPALFIVLLLLTGFFIIQVLNRYSPAIQFFIDPLNKPSSVEQNILKKAYRNPTASDYSELYKFATSVAKETPYIEIGRCAPYPRFAKVGINSEIIFTNSDKSQHTIQFTSKSKITLNPMEIKSVLLDFYHAAEVPYGYSCDNSKDAVGVLFVIDSAKK